MIDQRMLNLNNRHRDYAKIKEASEFMLKSYIGGFQYKDNTTLPKYQNESQTKYDDRVKRAIVVNFLATIIDEIRNTIFSKNIQRDCVNDSFDGSKFSAFVKNATYNNKSLGYFMKRVATLGSFERIGILIEGVELAELKKLGIETPESVSSDVKEKYNLYPRLKLFTPDKILNWSITDGQVNWVLLDYSYTDDTDFNNQAEVKKYVLWEKETFRVFVLSDTGNEVASDETYYHGLPYIPFLFFTQRDVDENNVSESLYEGVALSQRAIIDWFSAIDENVHSAIFSTLLVENCEEFPSIDNNNADKKKTPYTLTDNVLVYGHGTKPPQLLKTDFVNIPVILNLIDSATKDIHRLVGKYLDSNNYYAQSGIAKLVDQEQRNANISNYAKQLEEVENWILKTFAEYSKIIWKDDYASVYPSEFSTVDLKERIANALQLKTLFSTQSNTAAKIILKDLFMKIFGEKISDAEKAAIDAEFAEIESGIENNFEPETP